MGQYFVVANTTKKEFLHPHKFGSGLKFLEFTLDGCSVMSGLAHLLGQSSDGVAHDDATVTGRWIGDHVIIVGDYDTSGVFDEAMDGNDYTDISNAVIQHMGKDPYVQSRLSEHHRWDGGGANPVFQDGGSFMLPTLRPDEVI
tara:strand:+ start:515 stop:943 length:429 start_codon:yes stop_codon:yes gene_type:complete